MKKMKCFLIGAAIFVVSIVPVFANASGVVQTAQVSDSATSTTETVAVKGDVDGNGKVELLDAQMALKMALKIIETTDKQLPAADVDSNGKVELKDAQKILKVALKIDQTF